MTELADRDKRLATVCEHCDTWRTMHHEVEAERDAARRERDRARRALAEHADCDECEPEIQAALGLGPDPVEVERDQLAETVKRQTEAVDHLLDVYTHDNQMATIAAVDKLRRTVRGGT